MSDTDAQLSDALTAQAVAQRGAVEALLNRVTSIVTALQLEVLTMRDELSSHQVREEDGVAALREELAALREERRVAGEQMAVQLAELAQAIEELRGPSERAA